MDILAVRSSKEKGVAYDWQSTIYVDMNYVDIVYVYAYMYICSG